MRNRALACAVSVLAGACTSRPALPDASADRTLVLADATVIAMNGAPAEAHRTIVIRNGAIVSWRA